LAALHLESLGKQQNKKSMLTALEKLPATLKERYEDTVNRIRAQAPEDHGIAIRALTWTTYAREPLEPQALQEALAIRQDRMDVNKADFVDISRLISYCAGLLTLDSESGVIRLVHYTTQGALQNLLQVDGNAEIAGVCLHYLSFSVFTTIFENEWFLIDHLKKYKLSSYASRYWFVHVRESGEKAFIAAILDTFENQGTRDSVFQIAEYVKDRWRPLNGYGSPKINLLHLASMHGLYFLCEEVLRQSGKIQKL
jgi:hypothetical protein